MIMVTGKDARKAVDEYSEENDLFNKCLISKTERTYFN